MSFSSLLFMLSLACCGCTRSAQVSAHEFGFVLHLLHSPACFRDPVPDSGLLFMCVAEHCREGTAPGEGKGVVVFVVCSFVHTVGVAGGGAVAVLKCAAGLASATVPSICFTHGLSRTAVFCGDGGFGKTSQSWPTMNIDASPSFLHPTLLSLSNIALTREICCRVPRHPLRR